MTDRSVAEQLGKPGRYFILCNGCGLKLMQDNPPTKFLLALFGPQGLGDEDAVLLCVSWARRNISSALPFACDGCGRMVAVAPSSKWFIELHRAERA